MRERLRSHGGQVGPEGWPRVAQPPPHACTTQAPFAHRTPCGWSRRRDTTAPHSCVCEVNTYPIRPWLRRLLKTCPSNLSMKHTEIENRQLPFAEVTRLASNCAVWAGQEQKAASFDHRSSALRDAAKPWTWQTRRGFGAATWEE